MKRGLPLILLAALALLLGGCAAPTLRSEVTAFHEWPAQLPDQSFVFERSRAQDNDLEYRNYENLVRDELLRLGFTDPAAAGKAALKIGLAYQVNERDVRIVEPVVVNSGWGAPYYGPRWPYRYYDPFYDPFWYSPPVVSYQESNYRLYRRQLQVGITRVSDGKKLYDVTVISEGKTASLAAAMPYMVKSAFADFPGKSGVPRQVELEFKEAKTKAPQE
ncbi:DUF4136 domain-containing protein [Noviherbaspirillum sedimenti]|uniref:DUF4136 domain-containing protein n=1 Tax=Noviherbaspirillum sedimenti TaxID=2320865 RepID=A0A3A3G2W5_9BURK|nr:DUF4136 domain-containing protein [Noviherbaspirillum sedimenti]RJG02005.1 DUF4136 domain-containing protein [Noviherbaspirillum sedimenti]